MQSHWDTSDFPTLDDEHNVSSPSKFHNSLYHENAPGNSRERFSKDSRFSSNQRESATQILISILSEDELLKPLYLALGIHTRSLDLGLSMGLRRALETFAENLHVEANNHLQFQAYRLTRANARRVAEHFAGSSTRNVGNARDRSVSAILMNFRRRTSTIRKGIVEDKTVESQLIDADSRDPRAIRLFLTESSAYTTLQVAMHAVYMKRLATIQKRASLVRRPLPATKDNTERNWHSWQEDTKELARNLLLGFDRLLGAKVAVFLLLDFVLLLTDGIFIDLGWLEPPLPRTGWTRIRCEYVCLGKEFPTIDFH